MKKRTMKEQKKRLVGESKKKGDRKERKRITNVSSAPLKPATQKEKPSAHLESETSKIAVSTCSPFLAVKITSFCFPKT